MLICFPKDHFCRCILHSDHVSNYWNLFLYTFCENIPCCIYCVSIFNSHRSSIACISSICMLYYGGCKSIFIIQNGFSFCIYIMCFYHISIFIQGKLNIFTDIISFWCLGFMVDISGISCQRSR